jgi:hypothetical protein
MEPRPGCDRGVDRGLTPNRIGAVGGLLRSKTVNLDDRYTEFGLFRCGRDHRQSSGCWDNCCVI